MSVQTDPLAAAVEAGESAGKFFGKIEIDGQFVILKKGQRKQIWTEGMDTDGRQTELTIRLNPLDCTGMTHMIERQIIANFGEWSKIVWPSLRELGIKSLYDVRGKFAKVELVKSGESYQKASGETVEKTTFKFLQLFNTEAEATAAWEGGTGAQAHTPSSTPQAAAVDIEAEKAKLAPFLPTLVAMSKGDIGELAKTLKQAAPCFTVDSPEIQALLKAA